MPRGRKSKKQNKTEQGKKEVDDTVSGWKVAAGVWVGLAALVGLGIGIDVHRIIKKYDLDVVPGEVNYDPNNLTDVYARGPPAGDDDRKSIGWSMPTMSAEDIEKRKKMSDDAKAYRKKMLDDAEAIKEDNRVDTMIEEKEAELEAYRGSPEEAIDKAYLRNRGV
jgi:hypothetical protein